MKRTMVLVLGVALLLSACGSSTGDRTASGAGIGAGAGAVLGAVTGLSILQGVLIGAAAGGLTGALTSEDVIDLGDPIWATKDKPANKSAVARVQAGLSKLGYDPGPIDGVKGAKTTAAIKAYQRDYGLAEDGLASLKLAQHIEGEIEASGG